MFLLQIIPQILYQKISLILYKIQEEEKWKKLFRPFIQMALYITKQILTKKALYFSLTLASGYI